MFKRSLVIMSLVAMLAPAACKSGSDTAATSDSAAGQAASTTKTEAVTGSDKTSKADKAATKQKPQTEKESGQTITEAGITMGLPKAWVKGDSPAKAGDFIGLFAYQAAKKDESAGGVDVMKGSFPFVDQDTDRRHVWDAVAAANQADTGSPGEFGDNYESNDGFTYTWNNNGKTVTGYTTFLRKGDDLYYIDVYGDERVTEKQAWGIIESFDLK